MARPRKSPMSEAPVLLPRASEPLAPCSDCGNVPMDSEWPRRVGEEGFHTTSCDLYGPHSHHDRYVLFVFTPPAPPTMYRWKPNDPSGLERLV